MYIGDSMAERIMWHSPPFEINPNRNDETASHAVCNVDIDELPQVCYELTELGQVSTLIETQDKDDLVGGVAIDP